MTKPRATVNQPYDKAVDNLGIYEFDRGLGVFKNTMTGFTVSREMVDRIVGVSQYAISPKDMVHILEQIERDQTARAKQEEDVRKKAPKSAIAIDFDGVIHSYEKGWADGSIYGTLIPGTKEAIQGLMKRYNVFILTSRDPVQVKEWLQKYLPIPVVIISDKELFWNTPGVLGVTNHKYAAIAYIDDRAVPFTGWNGLAEKLGAK